MWFASRHVMSTSPPPVEYALTDLGRELQPLIAAIVDVGHRLKLRNRGMGEATIPSAHQARGARAPTMCSNQIAISDALLHDASREEDSPRRGHCARHHSAAT